MQQGVIRTIARDSRLSLLQADEIRRLLPGLEFDVIPTKSMGDKDLSHSLLEPTAEDFFTRELDFALLTGAADIAVHSAKDLPAVLHPALEVLALTESSDSTDSLVAGEGRTLKTLPPGSTVATSSRLRKQELLAARPDLKVVPVRGDIPSRLTQLDAGRFDALIVATCALKRLGLEGRISEVLPFRTHDLQGSLAVVGTRDCPFREAFGGIDIRRGWGRVHIVGAGAGGSEMLTLKAHRLLGEADAIFYDALLDEGILSEFRGEKTYVGKRAGAQNVPQESICDMLFAAVKKYKNIVRLKGGDPGVFGRLDEEYRHLTSRLVEVDIVPGISAAQSAAAFSAIPLTVRARARQLSLVSASTMEGGAFTYPFPSDEKMLVFYMAGSKLNAIAKKLLELGRPEDLPCAVFSSVGSPGQRFFICTLRQLRYSAFSIRPPILLMAGSPVRTRDYTKLRLNTSTTAEHDPHAMSVHTPLIKLTLRDIRKEDLEPIFESDYVLLTSPNASRLLRMALNLNFKDPAEQGRLRGMRSLAVGKTTAKISGGLGLNVYAFPQDESAAGLAGLFLTHRDLKGRKFRLFYPHSDLSDGTLAKMLTGQGHEVRTLCLYDNKVSEEAQKVDLKYYDQVYFASPSAVKAFEQLYGSLPEGMQFICRGDTTLSFLQGHMQGQE